MTYPGVAPVVVAELPAAVESAARSALDKLAADQGGLPALLRAGDPAVEILAAIDALKPALVAMGAHGRGGPVHALLGRVTERIVRSSPVPGPHGPRQAAVGSPLRLRSTPPEPIVIFDAP